MIIKDDFDKEYGQDVLFKAKELQGSWFSVTWRLGYRINQIFAFIDDF